MAKLTQIEGIGPALEAKLHEAGITTIDQLLEQGKTPAGRKKLAEQSGVDPKRLLRFVNHADLMRIKGVGGEMSELLEASGADTVPALARRNAANLAAKMAEVNADKKLVRSVPSEKEVAGWVEQAKELPRAVEY